MSRRKKGSPVHGWAIIDKPEGLTSTAVVSRVRRALDAQKAGHAGTLDPLATGVLAVALGEATKTIPFVVDTQKVYRFTVRWGEARDTDDRDGRVTATSPVRPAAAAILAALPRFVGEVMQAPPAYSAVKVDGERAYDLAREGEVVDLKPRPVWIGRLELVAAAPEAADFEMLCGKGTYVRSFARDLAGVLGTCGHVTALRRLAVGPFTTGSAIPLDNFVSSANDPAARTGLLPLTAALDDIPALTVTQSDVGRIRSGQPVLVRGRTVLDAQRMADQGAPVLVLVKSGAGDPVALAELERGELHPVRVFNFSA